MIRLLDPEKDMDLLREAWDWRDDAPRWFQESLAIDKESWDDFVSGSKDEWHYGIFSDGLMAVVRLIQSSPRVFNIHLSARRKTDFEVLLTAGKSIRDYLFDKGVLGFYGYLPTVNRGVSKLYEELGFTDTGIRVFKGQIRGRVGELKHYALLNQKMFASNGEIT